MFDLGTVLCWGTVGHVLFTIYLILAKKNEIYGNCLSKILKGFVVIVLNNVYCRVSGKYKKTQRRKKSPAILVNVEVTSLLYLVVYWHSLKENACLDIQFFTFWQNNL